MVAQRHEHLVWLGLVWSGLVWSGCTLNMPPPKIPTVLPGSAGSDASAVLGLVPELAAPLFKPGFEIRKVSPVGDWHLDRNDNSGIIVGRHVYVFIGVRGPAPDDCFAAEVAVGQEYGPGNTFGKVHIRPRFEILFEDAFPELDAVKSKPGGLIQSWAPVAAERPNDWIQSNVVKVACSAIDG